MAEVDERRIMLDREKGVKRCLLRGKKTTRYLCTNGNVVILLLLHRYHSHLDLWSDGFARYENNSSPIFGVLLDLLDLRCNGYDLPGVTVAGQPVPMLGFSDEPSEAEPWKSICCRIQRKNTSQHDCHQYEGRCNKVLPEMINATAVQRGQSRVGHDISHVCARRSWGCHFDLRSIQWTLENSLVRIL